jgi:hypothetical protein
MQLLIPTCSLVLAYAEISCECPQTTHCGHRACQRIPPVFPIRSRLPCYPARSMSRPHIQEMEKQFVAWNAEKGVTPANYTGALYGFIKKKLKREG